MKKLALFALLALASLSFGKGWSQPWTPKLPSWESVVYSCDYPKPYKLIAADDFYFDDFELPIRVISWWGTVTEAEQLNRAYYLAIYKDGGHCQPAWDSIVWKNCVKAKTEYVGEDCQGKKVFKFSYYLNPGDLTLGPGGYWLQVSESDKDSVKPDQVDFQWSSHMPVNKCPALQMDSNGVIYQPLIDPCYRREDDLAFEILG